MFARTTFTGAVLRTAGVNRLAFNSAEPRSSCRHPREFGETTAGPQSYPQHIHSLKSENRGD
jgi:hypothetical protein